MPAPDFQAAMDAAVDETDQAMQGPDLPATAGSPMVDAAIDAAADRLGELVLEHGIPALKIFLYRLSDKLPF